MLAIERALALCDAAEYGSASVVRELCSSPRLQMYIDQGVNVHATTALMSAAMPKELAYLASPRGGQACGGSLFP